MKLKWNVYFCDDTGERFFGEGPYRLLRGIEEAGSLRSAARRMDMAYTKAFGILKRAEKEFGFPLTSKSIGGKGGGGSVLTEEAKELIVRYESYRSAFTQLAENLYDQYFSDLCPASSDHRQPGDRENDASQRLAGGNETSGD